MIITLKNEVLDKLDMSYVHPENPLFIDFRNDKSGHNHYRLLAYISQQFDNAVFLDIGTRSGASACALASNPSNHVHSFDIYNTSPLPYKNVTYHIGNILEMSEWKERLIASSFISLDVDPHDGVFEKQFMLYLSDNSYKGMLYMDDTNIDTYSKLRDFWNSITLKKVDVTKYGHGTGSGIVLFDPSMEIEMV